MSCSVLCSDGVPNVFLLFSRTESVYKRVLLHTYLGEELLQAAHKQLGLLLDEMLTAGLQVAVHVLLRVNVVLLDFRCSLKSQACSNKQHVSLSETTPHHPMRTDLSELSENLQTRTLDLHQDGKGSMGFQRL